MANVDFTDPTVVKELLIQRDREQGIFVDGKLVAKEALLEIHVGTHLLCALMSKWVGCDDRVVYRLEFVTIEEEVSDG